jgi:tetratricopeptide (TPR) repeat protein
MKKLVYLSCGIILCFSTMAQQQQELFEKALALKKEYKFKEAFPIFQALLKADSTKGEYLEHASQAYTRYGYLYIEKEKEKQTYFKTAEYLALKAIAMNEKSAQAHFAYCLALGRINENAGNKQKIANSKLIKKEIDRTIELDPSIATAYHILGRWHSVISAFSPGEKKVINKLYGGVPAGASFEAAIAAYKKAMEMEPLVVLHCYEMAVTCVDMKNKTEANAWLDKALALAVVTDDDKINHDKALKLKKKIS